MDNLYIKNYLSEKLLSLDHMLNFTMHIDDSGDRLCKTSGNLWVGKIGYTF